MRPTSSRGTPTRSTCAISTKPGVPVVPTTWAAPGAPIALPEPASSSSSRRSGPVRAAPAGSGPTTGRGARAHADRLHEAGRTVMVQPYLDAVDTAGETALSTSTAGSATPSARRAMLPEASVNALQPGYSRKLLRRGEDHGPDARRRRTRARRQALDVRPRRGSATLLYARVDLLPGPDGPVVIELELVEPSLFLEFDDGAAAAPGRRRRCDGLHRMTFAGQPAARAGARAAPDEADRRRPAGPRRGGLRGVP